MQQCTSSSYQRWICLSVHPAKIPINPLWLVNDDQPQQVIDDSMSLVVFECFVFSPFDSLRRLLTEMIDII